MTDHLANYGSANLRVLFMDDARGKNIKTDTLFENLYDYWTSYHSPNKSLLVVWPKTLKTRNDHKEKMECKSGTISEHYFWEISQ